MRNGTVCSMSLTLRDYQKRIVEELQYLPSSALYMSTGTGKTITSLELIRINPTNNLLVVCPNSAIPQWKINIEKQVGTYEILEFKRSWSSVKINEFLSSLPKRGKYAIVLNYEMVYRIPHLLKMINEDWSIVADEIHRIKNYGARTKPVKSTRFMLRLGEKTPYKIGLSATPTQGKFGAYIDYYTQLKFLGYTELSYEEYYDKHVIFQKESYGTSPFPVKVIVGYRYTQEIEDTLKLVAKRYKPTYGDFEPQFNKIVLERTKNYPRFIREKAYIAEGVKILAVNSARARIGKKTLTTGRIMGKDMESNDYVFEDNTVKIDWIKDFLKDTDEVVTVFYSYNVERDNLVELCKSLGKKYIVIDGAAKDKYGLINKGGYDVVIGQFQAMSEAIDGLHHHCHIEVFFSMPESSIHYLQALGRIDRIGQKKVPMYYFLIMEKTIDEAIMMSIENKVEFSESMLNLLEV